MPSTARGITYPDSSGHTRLYEHYQTLATTTDTAIATSEASRQAALGITSLQAGSLGVPITASTFGTASFTFVTPFSAQPTFTATVVSAAGAAIGATVLVTVLSSTGFTVRVTLTASTTLTPAVHWIAVL